MMRVRVESREAHRAAMSDPDDRRFFEAQVLPLMDRLYGTALRLTRDASEAEDLVAETVARAWSKLDDLRDRDRFDGWIFRILANTFVSERRKRTPGLDRHVPDGSGGTEEEFSLFRHLHQPFLLWWGTPEQAFLNRLLRDDLRRALDDLPEVYRTVVVLVDLHGWRYAEVAQLFEVPVGTVRSRLSRGRSMLQRTLWEQARESGLVGGAGLERGEG